MALCGFHLELDLELDLNLICWSTRLAPNIHIADSVKNLEALRFKRVRGMQMKAHSEPVQGSSLEYCCQSATEESPPLKIDSKNSDKSFGIWNFAREDADLKSFICPR